MKMIHGSCSTRCLTTSQDESTYFVTLIPWFLSPCLGFNIFCINLLGFLFMPSNYNPLADMISNCENQ